MMAQLERIWIEHHANSKPAIRIDWDNDRHQRIEVKDTRPEGVANALKEAGALVNAERVQGKI